MYRLLNVSKTFKDKENIVNAVNNVSLTIEKGSIHGIIGFSGAGKSTLVRCLNLLEVPDSGKVIFNGKDLMTLKGKELRKSRQKIGMIFQHYNLVERLSVIENVLHGRLGYKSTLQGVIGIYTEEEKKNAFKVLSMLGLEEQAYKRCDQLSGGQKQRVAIARALALDPKILLCDEATSALDPKITKDILALLSKINKELGITIVIVTHQMEVIKEVCERVALLDGGKIQVEGKAEDLFLKPGSSLKKFLGEEEDTTLPNEGVNIRIFFPADCSENAIITKMAREANIDCSIVSGKLEKFRDNVLGSLVINIEKEDKNIVEKYLKDKDFEWEVI